ncbi:hypothetical protein ACA910_008112 [Epithemia clementina (nom. ined.)]
MTVPRSPEQARRVERFVARQHRQRKQQLVRQRKQRLVLFLLGAIIALRYYFMSPPPILQELQQQKPVHEDQPPPKQPPLQGLRKRSRSSPAATAATVSVTPAEAQRMLQSQQHLHQQARREQDEFCRQWKARLDETSTNMDVIQKLPPLVPSALEEIPSLFHNDATYWMEVYPEHDIVSHFVLDGGAWEKEATLRVAQWLQEYQTKHDLPSLVNVTFVDIGANVGWYTFAMADLGATVIAVEPLPSNVELMRRSLCRNPQFASRITIHAMALSSSSSSTPTTILSSNNSSANNKNSCVLVSSKENVGDGVLQCSQSTKDANNNNYTHNPTAEGRKPQREEYALRATNIPLHRLDDVIGSTLPEHQHIGALKMDTEGHEGHIVQGGKLLFTSGRIPHIQSEFVPSWIQAKMTSSSSGGKEQQRQHASPHEMLQTLLLPPASYQVRRDAVTRRGDSEPYLTLQQALNNKTGLLRSNAGVTDILFEKEY